MPAKAGIQNHLKILDSRLRGNDVKGRFKTFYETINIERPTSNNVFCQFKKRLSKANLPFEIQWIACFKTDKAQRHQYSTFDVGRSMFSVQSVYCSGEAEFIRGIS